jgi:hypothetical protein
MSYIAAIRPEAPGAGFDAYAGYVNDVSPIMGRTRRAL